MKEKDDRVNDDDDCDDDHDDDDNEEEDGNKDEIDYGEKDSDGGRNGQEDDTNSFVITEVGIDSDEDGEDDIQFALLVRRVTCFGRLASPSIN